jgi:hypothetical protein
MPAVPKRRIAAQRAQERLLERVFRTRAAESTREEGEHVVPVCLVEPLEGREAHDVHHLF